MRVAEASADVLPGLEEPRRYRKDVAEVPGEQASTTSADSQRALTKKLAVDSGAGGLEENG